jgi:hypothetical protein
VGDFEILLDIKEGGVGMEENGLEIRRKRMEKALRR